MKKIILTLVLILNIAIAFRNGHIEVYTPNSVYAQNAEHTAASYLNSLHNGNTYQAGSNGMIYQFDGFGGFAIIHLNQVNVPANYTPPSPSNGNSSSGGFSGWISNIWNAISNFFSNGEGDGEGFGEEDEPLDWGPEYIPDDLTYDPMSDPFMQPPGMDNEEWDVLHDLWVYYNEYVNPPVKDCAGVSNGNATVGSCGFCSAIASCQDTTLPRKDTAKATKVDCDTLANKRGNELTTIDNAVSSLTDMHRLSDSAYHSNNESGLCITKDGPSVNYGVFNFNTGNNSSVGLPTSDTAHIIVACHHTHPFGTANTPSPGDLYHLLEAYNTNNNFLTDFVTANDSSQFALMITNPANVANFLASYPRDSVIAGNPVNNWDSVRNGINKSIFRRYEGIMSYFYNNKHYPIEFVQAYANVYMLEESFNYPCVKMYKKVNGQFKELKIKKEFDTNGKITDVVITICQ